MARPDMSLPVLELDQMKPVERELGNQGWLVLVEAHHRATCEEAQPSLL
jgi:hypothetical protein